MGLHSQFLKLCIKELSQIEFDLILLIKNIYSKTKRRGGEVHDIYAPHVVL